LLFIPENRLESIHVNEVIHLAWLTQSSKYIVVTVRNDAVDVIPLAQLTKVHPRI
jgi:hypothetical protein